MTVRVYSSLDNGAPVITGLAGDLGWTNTLIACLVNGYDTQAAAGWSVAFTSTNTTVLRAGGGRRAYLRIDESNAQYPIVRGYLNMTSVDSGDGAFPTTAQLAGAISPVKSSTTTNVARPWIVIANNRAFYFWIGFGVTDINAPNTSTDVTFFGDIVSYLPGDTYNTALIGRTTSSTTASDTRLSSVATISSA